MTRHTRLLGVALGPWQTWALAAVVWGWVVVIWVG